jgi:hypothetical protein
MSELTEEQALGLYGARFWEGMSDRDVAMFQMHTERLCMPFDVLHGAVERTLGRPVFSHEFGSAGAEQIRAELDGTAPPPTFEEILNLIPAEKRVVIGI